MADKPEVFDARHTGPQIDEAVGRALPGGEIDGVLAGKAPGGYGYGDTIEPIVFWDDKDGKQFEAYVDAMLLRLGADKVKQVKIVDYPSCLISGNGGFGQIFSSQEDGSAAYVVYYGMTYADIPSMAIKQKYGNSWYPWEYINPPMVLGVEYRTTERYLRKPVYAKLLQINNLPSAIGTDKLVEFLPENERGETVSLFGYMRYFGTSLPYPGVAGFYTNGNRIGIRAERDLSLGTVLALIKYTKRTD